MARCKSSPETVRAKCELAERLRLVRTEQFGERGGPELARRLGLPIRTWYNYEVGVTVPAEVLLKFMELTSVEPMWLLHGQGPMLRRSPRPPVRPPSQQGDQTTESVTQLLRAALEMLEDQPIHSGRADEASIAPPTKPDQPPDPDREHAERQFVQVKVEQALNGKPQDSAGTASNSLTVRRDWLPDPRHSRCLNVPDEAMEPLLRQGAFVGYHAEPETPAALDGAIVVARLEDRPPLVRRLQYAGRVALLRAENPAGTWPVETVDLTDSAASEARFHRVLWVSTPH